jgi:hypothetical protein
MLALTLSRKSVKHEDKYNSIPRELLSNIYPHALQIYEKVLKLTFQKILSRYSNITYINPWFRWSDNL